MPATCPKCGTSIGSGGVTAQACGKCGLSVDRMASFAAARDNAVPDVLGNAWDQVTAAWDDPAKHDELMRLVAQHDAFAWVAARYRTRAGDPVAEKQLERVRKAAEVTLLSSAVARKAGGTKNPYRNTTAMLVVLVVLIAGGLIYAWVRSGSRAEPTPPQVEKK